MRARRYLAALALALAACGGSDKSTGPGGTLEGTYALKTINGRALPAVVFQIPDDKVEITSGSVTMNANNSFSETVTLRETITGSPVEETPITCPGTYTRSGSAITFSEPETEDCGGTYTGTWSSGNTLTVNFGGVTGVFRK